MVMRITPGKVIFACFLLGSAAYGVTVLRGPHGLAGMREKRSQIETLEKENEKLQKEIAAKKDFLTRLEQNPDELELEIEKRLRLVKPGKKVYILQDGTPSESPAKPETQPSR